jgi:hypothetical protein
MVYIKHSDLIPNDCDYIIQVFWYFTMKI